MLYLFWIRSFEQCSHSGKVLIGGSALSRTIADAVTAKNSLGILIDFDGGRNPACFNLFDSHATHFRNLEDEILVG